MLKKESVLVSLDGALQEFYQELEERIDCLLARYVGTPITLSVEDINPYYLRDRLINLVIERYTDFGGWNVELRKLDSNADCLEFS